MFRGQRKHLQATVRGALSRRFAVAAAAILAIGGILRRAPFFGGVPFGGALGEFVLGAATLAALFGALRLLARNPIEQPLRELADAVRRRRERGRPPIAWHGAPELDELAAEIDTAFAAQIARKSQHAAAEGEARRKLQLLEAAIENLGQGVCVYDHGLRLTAFNWRYLELHDLPRGSVQLGMPLEDLLELNAERGEYGFTSSEAIVADRLALARSGSPHGRERERPDGTILDIQTHPMPGGGFVSTYTDITQRRDYEIQMRHLTLHDVLTHLPNRALFHDRLRQSLKAATASKRRVALLLVDIDRFKEINDTRGHAVGDRLLQEVAGRLSELTRDGDTAATLGGDELAVIQSDLEQVDEAALLAGQILEVLARPYEIDEREVRITVSIGITVFPDDGEHHEQMVRNADLALHAAKAEGRARYRYFVPEMNRQVQQRKALEEALAKALEQGDQLTLCYQPQASLRKGEVVAVEALLRWNHPERGLIPPTEIIPVAEEYGLIAPLTEWVLEEACRRAASWRGGDRQTLRVAVNLSASSFRDERIVAAVEGALRRTELPARLLELEITESAIMENPELAAKLLGALRELGVSLALDDFGTGYSSLSYLRRFPIDTLKIDRSFVRDLPDSPEAATIVKTIIGLGNSLGLRVVAEGVETSAQISFLRATECDEIQGFHLSPPLPSDTLETWLDAHLSNVFS